MATSRASDTVARPKRSPEWRRIDGRIDFTSAGTKGELRFRQDALPEVRGQSTERDTGNDGVGATEVSLAQDAAHVGGGAMNHEKARVVIGLAQVTHKLLAGFDSDERGVRTKALEDLRRKSADTGAVLDEHTGRRPIDLTQQPLDEETRAGQRGAEQNGMPEEFSCEQQPGAVLAGILHVLRRQHSTP